MKFRIIATSIWGFNNDEVTKKILDKYPTLNEYPIEIVDGKLYVTLNGLEDLLKLSKRYGELIVSSGDIIDGEDTIEIYDDYRE